MINRRSSMASSILFGSRIMLPIADVVQATSGLCCHINSSCLRLLHVPFELRPHQLDYVLNVSAST
jgi:hypothetical protein